MNFRRILGFIILVIGVLMMIVAYSIKHRTEEGTQQVKAAQKKVDKVDDTFSLSPVTKPLGDGLTGSAQKKIDKGKEEILYYENIAKWLKLGGILVIVAGVIIVLIPRKGVGRF
jgi:hypothetical protein